MSVENKETCITCKKVDNCDTVCIGYENYEQENKMKPQFTEEEARELVFKCLDSYDSIREQMVITMKEKGYIRKSDLEILIEEAEKLWKNKWDSHNSDFTELEIEQRSLIHKLKAELNKRNNNNGN